MSKPSDGAMRAAEVIFKEGYWDVYKTREETFESRWERINNPEKLAHIIDRETGYPELFYAIEMLEEIVTGEVVHLYRGNCPEPGAEKERDEDCPACLRLRAADSLIAKAKGEDR